MVDLEFHASNEETGTLSYLSCHLRPFSHERVEVRITLKLIIDIKYYLWLKPFEGDS